MPLALNGHDTPFENHYNQCPKSKDSQTRSIVLIWIKKIHEPAPSSDLNQRIRDFKSGIANHNFRSWLRSTDGESFNSWNDSQTCSKVLIGIKWFTISTLKSPSESNDSWSTLRSPDLNQIIRDAIQLECFETVNHLATADSEFGKALFHPSLYMLFFNHYKQCLNSKIKCSFALFFFFFFWVKWSKSRPKWLTQLIQLSLFSSSSGTLHDTVSYYYWLSSLVLWH